MSPDQTEELSCRLWTLQLYQEFDETLHYYRVKMPRPHIELSESRTIYGSYAACSRTLRISVHLIREHSWDVVLEVLKHEMAHMLVGEDSEASGSAHGPAFQEACRRLGVAPWARRAAIEVDPTTALQQHRQLSAEQERLLRRIEKLLSLASSSQEHEASLAMQRARELCARHQVEAFAAGQQQDYTYVLIQHQKKVSPAHQASIASILSHHFYVDCVMRQEYNARAATRFKVLEILGTRENVQMAEYVYWFLWNQLPLLWQHHRAAKQTQSPVRSTRVSQRSFYLGVLRGFDDKLTQQKTAMEQQALARASDDQLVPLADRRLEARLQTQLKQFVKERFPHLHRSGGRRQNLSADDFSSGRQRGRELNLHRGLTETHRGAIQLLHSGKG